MNSVPGTQLAGRGQRLDPEVAIQELAREDCLELLAAHHVGRVAVVTQRDTPMIRPVNYEFDHQSQSIVFRTDPGSKLHALRHATKAAFEIDGTNDEASTAWSVIVEGVTAEVSRLIDLRRLQRLGLEPVAPGPKAHWIQIRVWTVSGRRITLAGEASSGQRRG